MYGAALKKFCKDAISFSSISQVLSSPDQMRMRYALSIMTGDDLKNFLLQPLDRRVDKRSMIRIGLSLLGILK